LNSKARIVYAALLLNLSFWAWFWVDVWRHTAEYTDRTPQFEEVLPVYKFRSRALPPEAERTLMSFGSMLLVQRPAFLVAGQVATFTSRSWEQRVGGGLSVGAYVLIGTMILSFVQWAAILLLGKWALAALKGSQSRPTRRSV
jgi:hypothetical protein